MTVIAQVLSWLVLSVPLHGQGLPLITVWVPGAYATNAGNYLDSEPFADHIVPVSHRFQQVFAADDFQQIQFGGYITGMSFRRRGSGSAAFAGYSSRFQVNMSTIQAVPDGLREVFSANVGTNDTIVFGPGRLEFIGTAEYGDLRIISFDTPFLYEPTQGNLLLDMRNFSGNDLLLFPHSTAGGDSVASFGDSISTVRAEDVTSTSGRLDTGGYIVGFQFEPLPRLSDAVVGKDLVLTWSAVVSGFILEMTGSLSPPTVWTAYSGQVHSDGSWNAVTVPLASLGDECYFRLRRMQ